MRHAVLSLMCRRSSCFIACSDCAFVTFNSVLTQFQKRDRDIAGLSEDTNELESHSLCLQVPAPLDRRQLVVIGNGRFVLVDIQSVIARAVGARPDPYSSPRNAQLVDALDAAAGLLPGRTPVGCCADNAERLRRSSEKTVRGASTRSRPYGAPRR